MERGGETDKEHFHIYMELDAKTAHNWSRIFKTYCEKNKLNGNEDFSQRRKNVKNDQYYYCCKGDSPDERPRVKSNFLSESEVEVLQREYWKRKSAVDAVLDERVPDVKTSDVKVEVNGTDSEVIQKLKLQLEVEREKTKRKATKQFKPEKLDFHEYIVKRFNAWLEEYNYQNGNVCKWDIRDVAALDKFLVGIFVQQYKPRYCHNRPLREFRNYLIGTVDIDVAYRLIMSDH